MGETRPRRCDWRRPERDRKAPPEQSAALATHFGSRIVEFRNIDAADDDDNEEDDDDDAAHAQR